MLRPAPNKFFLRPHPVVVSDVLHVPEGAERNNQAYFKGTVVFAGRNEHDIKVGDVLIYSKYAELEFAYNDEKLVMVNYDEEVPNIIAKEV